MHIKIKITMKIQYMSDFHLEFRDNMQYIKDNHFPVTGDVLVLAGDTAYLSDTTVLKLKLWKTLAKNYRQVLIVPGNHEFYGYGDVLANGDAWEKMLQPNVGYYQNRVVRIDDTDFILSTLWSHIRPQDEYFVAHGMNDFRQIRYGGHRFTTGDFNTEHEKCLIFIKEAVKASDAKNIVVVTHHLPSYAVVDSYYKGDSLTSAFATELSDYIIDSSINVWIFGHSHSNINAQLGSTKLLCNQMGYVAYGEHCNGFNPECCVEL